MGQPTAAPRIGFIGVGRLAQGLALALQRRGLPPHAAFSRDREHALHLQQRLPQVLVTDTAQALVDDCDLVFLTVRDDAIEPVCASLRWRSGVSVVHCSGATEVSMLDAALQQGARIGGFHPLHTFGDPEVAAAGLAGCTIAVEGDEVLVPLLREMAMQLGAAPLVLPPGARALYHASAHYAGAFVVGMMREATQLWNAFGADEQQALDALLPLLRSTVAAISKDGLSRSMAGVVARGDEGTLRRHLQALDALPREVGELYRELSLRTVPLAQEKGALSAEAAASLRQVLSMDTPKQQP